MPLTVVRVTYRRTVAAFAGSCLTALLLVGLAPSLRAQGANVFTLEEFLTSVQLYHPVARMANLQNERARAELLLARGFLDPKFDADWSQKNFDDKLYYQIYGAKLKVPTALGIDVVGGYEQSDGIFLNPERTTDELGLWNLGLEADLIQGLIMNERRVALDRADVIQQLNETERQAALNDLLYDAGGTYAEWQQYYHYGEVLDTNVLLAERYYINTRESYEGGEYSTLDTLEAFILYQDALTERQKNTRKLIKARQEMENYLWFDNTPLELQPGIVPEKLPVGVPFIFVDPNVNLIANNPEIQSYLFTQEILQIEQRLKRIKNRPKLKVKYNAQLATQEESIRPGFNRNDFKWGFDFSMPLLFRRERAEVQLGEIKIRENGLKLLNKQNELNNKLDASLRQIDVLREQVAIMQDNVERYALLLEGESTKFIFGESSVFLLNKRQEKFIDSQLKLIELKTEIRKEFLNYRYLANDLIEGLPNE